MENTKHTGNRQESLDTLLSSSSFFSGRWSPKLKRNQSRDVLHYILCRLFGDGRGNLFHAQVRLSHENIAAHADLSREWVCTLSGRLIAAGWLEYRAPRLPDGTYEVGRYRPGRMLKRLLCMLRGFKPKYRVNDSSQSSPSLKSKEVKKRFTVLIREDNEPPSEAVMRKYPLIGKWWVERGETV